MKFSKYLLKYGIRFIHDLDVTFDEQISAIYTYWWNNIRS